MGGRGSSFATPSSGVWSSGIGTAIPGSLKQALGAKGKGKTIGDAVVETNPYYSRDYREYSQNCQRCVVAYELRRRGYDVTSLPTYAGDKLPTIAHIDSGSGVYNARWRGAFQNARTENVGVPGNNSGAEKAVLKNIEDKMRSWGDKSRAVIQILYRGGSGHVFNVENQNGRIAYVEAQAGKIKNIQQTLADVKTGSVNIVRVDNLRVSERAKNFVRKSAI